MDNFPHDQPNEIPDNQAHSPDPSHLSTLQLSNDAHEERLEHSEHPTNSTADNLDRLDQSNRSSRSHQTSARKFQHTHTPVVSVLLSIVMWFSAAVLVFVCVWYLGPNIVEQYYYSAVKGQATAEHEVAKVALTDHPLADLSHAYRLIVNRIRPSVVHIDTAATTRVAGNLGYESKGQGSGVIMDESGYIMTNEHVIKSAKKIQVTLFDRRTFSATVVGLDAETDLAVLKIEADDLIAAQWGNSDEATFGSLVWAVGSPFGLTQSVTHGIVSATHRHLYGGKPNQDLLQTDAPINPGNSGGPLVNAQGEVIGINTSILGESYQGVSFAVSSVVAQDVYEKIKKHGTVKRGFLGVKPELITHRLSKNLKLSSLDGAYISLVEANSPADLAGIKVGDVIVKWNAMPVDTDAKLFRHVAMTPADSAAEVTLIRDGSEQNVIVNVGRKRPMIRFD